MFLQHISFLKIFKSGIDFVSIKKEYAIFTNKIQIQIHSNLQLLFFLFFKKTILLKLNEIVEIAVVDKNLIKNRFLLNYLFLSLKYSVRVIIRVLNNGVCALNSMSFLFKGVSWLEREAYDMFGIFFRHNFDLRRILTDYGFSGFPLRKDFPVFGFFEKYFSISENVISTNKISLLQELRFDQKK
jgi:NADH:ubiquinone oxidoreductase subunit C